MWNCIKSQIDGDADISLSAGNTGVLLVISRMILKMMSQLSKPALAGLWPNRNGMNVVLILVQILNAMMIILLILQNLVPLYINLYILMTNL